MTDHKNWQPNEDQVISKYVRQHSNGDNSKIKWTQVANLINSIGTGIKRSGKQCRQRWWNQLNPEIKKETGWSLQEEQILFMAHDKLGNKWAEIAKQISGRTDNSIKNHFYSALRKGMRRINKYISCFKKKQTSIKPFKQDAMNKMLMVADGNFDSKLEAKQKAIHLAPIIKKQLIQLSMIREDQQITQKQQLKEQLLSNFQEFTRNCKKRKGKKRDQKEYVSDNQYSLMEVQSSNKQSHMLNRVKSDGNLFRKTENNLFGKFEQISIVKAKNSNLKTQQKIEEENQVFKNQVSLSQFKDYKLIQSKQEQSKYHLRRMNSNFSQVSQVSQQNEKGIFSKTAGFSIVRNESLIFGQSNYNCFPIPSNQQKLKSNNEGNSKGFLSNITTIRRPNSVNSNNEGPGNGLIESVFYDLNLSIMSGNFQNQNHNCVIESMQFNQNRNPMPSMLQESGMYNILSNSITYGNFLERSNPDLNVFNNNFDGVDFRHGKQQ